jgi:hypothetical protein
MEAAWRALAEEQDWLDGEKPPIHIATNGDARKTPPVCAASQPTPSHYFRRHPLNLRHIVVKNGLLDAIIPLDGYARPVLFDDGALIDLIVLPANAVPTVSNRDWSPVMHQTSVGIAGYRQ